MPFYDFKCAACGEKTEVFSSRIEERVDEIDCAKCGSYMKRALSTISVLGDNSIRRMKGNTCCGASSDEGCSERGRCCEG